MQLPLTFQQQWLWGFLQTHANWNCAVAYAFRLKGDLSVPMLQKSLEEVVRRHESLRTRIVMIDGSPKQETDDPRAVDFDVTSVASRCAAESEEHAQRIFAEFADRVVDPTVGPPLSVQLLRLSDREHWLLIGLHRLSVDCFSAEQIFHELWGAYGEFLCNRPAPFKEEPAQYGEYAIWQHSTSREWSKRHAGYWRNRLAGAMSLQWPPDPSLATEMRRAGNGRLSRLFGEALSEDLRDLARRSKALLATVMLTVYVAVLRQWCGQSDFIVPFNIAGRQSAHKHIVGYFSHILYLRMQLTGAETFSELLGQVSMEFFRALTHQDFGRMALQEPQLLAGTYFQWVTSLSQSAASQLLAPGTDLELAVERLPLREFGAGISALPPGTIDVDLTFFDTPTGIYAGGWYRADRFSGGTMERFLEALRATAERFVSGSGCR